MEPEITFQQAYHFLEKMMRFQLPDVSLVKILNFQEMESCELPKEKNKTKDYFQNNYNYSSHK